MRLVAVHHRSQERLQQRDTTGECRLEDLGQVQTEPVRRVARVVELVSYWQQTRIC